MSEKIRTTDYKKFKIKADNRAIDKAHVRHLVHSIQSANMLEYRPIIVDEEYYVLDGQHRLEACKELGCEVWYEIKKDTDLKDIMNLNISKSWGTYDYYNFYVTNKYPEYLKLSDFMKKHGLDPKEGLYLLKNDSKGSRRDFKEGTFVFDKEDLGKEIDLAFSMQETLKEYTKNSIWWRSKKVLLSLFRIASRSGFLFDHWVRNVKRYADKLCIRASHTSQVQHFIDVYNKGAEVKLSYDEV